MDLKTLLIIAHIIGTSLGVGGATVGDFLFFKSVKDGTLDASELRLLKVVSSVVWIGFIILVFSGFGFLLWYRLTAPEAALIYNPKLWAKLAVVGVILVNGLVMHGKLYPLLEANVGKRLATGDFPKRAGLAFTTGAISIISWYTTLILGVWKMPEASFLAILGVYALILAIGIFIAHVIGRKMLRTLSKPNV